MTYGAASDFLLINDNSMMILLFETSNTQKL